MDIILQAVITALPNMGVAIWVLWRDDKRISALLEQQKWLIEQLMSLHPPADKPEGNSQEETD